MGATEEEGLLSFHLHSEGKHFDMLWMESPGSAHRPFITTADVEAGMQYPKMEGQTVFKHATRRFAEVIREGLAHNNLTVDDVDCFFFHQANLRIIEMLCKVMKIPAEKTYNNIQKYGNTTAASIPLCLSEARQAGRIKRGDLICPVAFGSGFTWASALIRW
jgi:3-oxoacyl-[acyl-carrier-protein] synthase-3